MGHGMVHIAVHIVKMINYGSLAAICKAILL